MLRFFVSWKVSAGNRKSMTETESLCPFWSNPLFTFKECNFFFRCDSISRGVKMRKEGRKGITEHDFNRGQTDKPKPIGTTNNKQTTDNKQQTANKQQTTNNN